jgi:hypothetical protein
MGNHTTTYVDCFRDGKLITTYEFLCPGSLALPPQPPANEKLILEAKTNLTDERLAVPPYEGITFKVRR